MSAHMKLKLAKKSNHDVSKIEKSVLGDFMKSGLEVPREVMRRSNYKHLRPTPFLGTLHKK